jgi:hypothetical protein
MDSSVSTLILGHLSEHNNYPTLVEQMAEQALAQRGLKPRLHVAEPGKQSCVFDY